MKKTILAFSIGGAAAIAINCGTTISEPIDEEGAGGDGGSGVSTVSTTGSGLDGCGCPFVPSLDLGTASAGVTSGGSATLGIGYALPGGGDLTIHCTGSTCTCTAPSGSCSCTWDGGGDPCCGIAPSDACTSSVASTSSGCETSVAASTSGAGGYGSGVSVAASSGAGGCEMSSATSSGSGGVTASASSVSSGGFDD